MSRPGSENRPGPNARKRPPDAGPSKEERILGAKIRTFYQHERSVFESMRTGKSVVWRIPSIYDGKGKPGAEAGGSKPPKEIWTSLAKWFIANKVDPQDYVRWAFEKIGFGRAPEPPHLIKDTNLVEYRDMLIETRDTVLGALQSQTGAFKAAMHLYVKLYGYDELDAVEIVLIDKNLSMSALFRHCMAADTYLKTNQNRFLDLAVESETDAVFQYMQRREAYLDHWRRFLPIGFDVQAVRHYDRLMFNEEDAE